MNNPKQQIPQIKVVLLGDEAVGKTSLLRKWTSNVYEPNQASTIGGAAQIRRDQVNGVQYSFQIWDTAGAERYRALAPLYARDSYSALVVFDMTRRRTFESLEYWSQFLHTHGQIPFIIVGNKSDLTDSLEITSEEATNYAFSVSSQFFETSAKLGDNVDLAFRQLEMSAVEYYQKKGPIAEQVTMAVNSPGQNAGKGECC
ncbi:small GTP-binding protein [Tritrichomonas foetus]|uniref:Small GTP-binding protein n=1 Tax=Tritrichomonas foetus TaxID=1144522 RepID=A0A1J4J488_9EUKA|nr:small GTP-binding protein [Tritrichomonas foetus]|eukprot:OHS94178.1 small GTP-binding protein [Tritrichomonas foetus]